MILLINDRKTMNACMHFSRCRQALCGTKTKVIPAQYYDIHTQLAIGSISRKPDVFMTMYRDIDFGLLRLDTTFNETTFGSNRPERSTYAPRH